MTKNLPEIFIEVDYFQKIKPETKCVEIVLCRKN